MSDPKTLLSMSGADLTPSSLSNATVLLIDCQMEYVSGGMPLPGVTAALDEIGKLLERARAAACPIVHIAHKGAAGGMFDRDAERGQFVPEAGTLAGEAIIEKSLPNAFAHTGLEQVLGEIGRKELIVAGFMTHMCISSTVRAGLDLGYRNTVIDSATATRDLPAIGGGVIDAKALHNASLAALSDRFAIIAASTGDLPD